MPPQTKNVLIDFNVTISVYNSQQIVNYKVEKKIENYTPIPHLIYQ